MLHPRLQLGLRQEDVAAILNVDRATIINWETRHWVARVNLMPSIIQFLNGVPRLCYSPGVIGRTPCDNGIATSRRGNCNRLGV